MAEKLAPVGVRIDAIEAYRPSLKWSARNINRKLSYAYNRYESDVAEKLKIMWFPKDIGFFRARLR